MQKTLKSIETMAEQGNISNKYQHDRVKMVFKNLCILVIRTKVATALIRRVKILACRKYEASVTHWYDNVTVGHPQKLSPFTDLHSMSENQLFEVTKCVLYVAKGSLNTHFVGLLYNGEERRELIFAETSLLCKLDGVEIQVQKDASFQILLVIIKLEDCSQDSENKNDEMFSILLEITLY